MADDVEMRGEKLQARLVEMRGYLDVTGRRQRLAELESQAAQPGFWNDQNAARATIAITNAQRAVLKPFGEIESAVEESGLLIEMMNAEKVAAQRDEIEKELEALLTRTEEAFGHLEVQSLLNGRMDSSNAYLTVHAGAGGTESCDWAEMLMRMYRRFCERHGFELEMIDYQAGEEAGIRSATLGVSGPYAYGFMKAERGVHRLVRISPFDSNKRRHTSFVSLDVVAEVDEDIEVEIRDEDVRIDTYRSGGAGGQHVNKTDSAVRLTHLPTGIVVACQAERSQHKNKAKAQKILKAKLYEWHLDRQRKDLEKFYGDKGDMAWGSQIRSYVLQPYTLVKDHRTDTETSNVQAVLDGDLRLFIDAYLKHQVSAGVK
ncbi:MAG: peptide chain release factor 2 [Verrucomicrobia bacterium]|nr:peptide chain release factor 2 [Verrucomicrobiota bacterium]